jgi:hypothetical protein
MKIDSLEQQSLNILRPDMQAKAAQTQAAQAREHDTLSARGSAQGDQVAAPSIDFSQLGDAHTLDPDRVAALIADPFGGE